MDEIETRLKEAAEDCIKAYENWSTQKKNQEARERLQEATHELRKVGARLEIEIAVSERDDMAQRPIPIPPHRSSNRRPGNGLPDFIKDGNSIGDDEGGGNISELSGNNDRPQQSTRSPRQGGGASGGFQRRPMRRPHSSATSGGNAGGSSGGSSGGEE